MACAMVLMMLLAGTTVLESPLPFLSVGTCTLLVLTSLNRGELALVKPIGPLPCLGLMLLVATKDLTVWMTQPTDAPLWHLFAITLLLGGLHALHHATKARTRLAFGFRILRTSGQPSKHFNASNLRTEAITDLQ